MGDSRRIISFYSPSTSSSSASCPIGSVIGLLLFITAISIPSSAIPPSSVIPLTTSSSSSSSVSVNKNYKVKVALYYETLCPYCSNLIVNYLYKIFDDGLDAIVDLKLIPYGNAKIRSNNTIVCQHGSDECLLNTIEACAIHVWPNVKDYFPFVYCIETLVYEGDYSQWETCFGKLNLDPKPVTDCYVNGYGDKLELRYAAETNALEPPHTYVPWLVVDGQPLYDDYTDFISYICKAYKGTTLPEACSKSSLRSSTERENSILKVCYTAKASKATLSGLISAVKSWIRLDNVVASI